MSVIVDSRQTTRSGAEKLSVEEISKFQILRSLQPQEQALRKKDGEYLEYQDYLGKVFATLSMQAAQTGAPLKVSKETIIRELPFWKIKGFVWPAILHNSSGGVVLYWKSGKINLRIERKVEPDNYSIIIWTDPIQLLKPEIGSTKYLESLLPEVYEKIMADAHPDWKNFFRKRFITNELPSA